MSAKATILVLLALGLTLTNGCKPKQEAAKPGKGRVATAASQKQLGQAQSRARNHQRDLAAQLDFASLAFDHGLYNDAYRAYRQALEIDSQNYAAITGMARTNLKLHEPVQALGWVQRAQQLKPKDPELVPLEAQAYLLSGRSELAITSFRRAVALDPGQPTSWLNLASAQAQLNQNAEAVVAARQAVKLAPENATAHFALGRYYQRAGDLANAEAEYRDALKLDSKHAWAMVALARLLMDQNRKLEEARTLAVSASQLQSDRTDAGVIAAWILHLQGNDQQAANDLMALVNTMPQDPEAWQKLSVILQRLGKTKEAASAGQMAKQFIPHRRQRDLDMPDS